MSRIEINQIIQAVLRCKKCGQFLNLYDDHSKQLFNLHNSYYEDEFEILPIYKHNFYYNIVHESGILKCKCPGAISNLPIYWDSYLEDKSRYENFFMRKHDHIGVKMGRLVAKFFSTKDNNKIYYGLACEADSFHLESHSDLGGPFITELNEVRTEIIKSKKAAKFTLEESFSPEIMAKLNSLKKQL